MPLTSNAPIGTDIMRAIGRLCDRDVVLVPTETEYVLACNALDPEAVSKLLSMAGDTPNAPVEILVPSFDRVTLYAKDVPPVFQGLAQSFAPGRLTFLLNKKYVISDRLTAGSQKAAITLAYHPLTAAMLEKLHFPLAVVRVSAFHSPEEGSVDILDLLGDRIGYVLDGGATVVGPGSTWLEMGEDSILIHRTGTVTREDVERVGGMSTLQHLSPMAPERVASKAEVTKPV